MRFVSIFVVIAAGVACAQDSVETKVAAVKDGLSLTVDIKGGHTNDQWNSGQEWPFALQGEAEVPYAALVKLMPAARTEKPVDLDGAPAIFEYFEKGIADKENGEAVRKAAGKIRGRIKDQAGARTVVELSGSIRLEWTIQGNAFWVEGQEIEGSVVFEAGKAVAFEIGSKKLRTGGTWDWGGGSVPMGGKVSAFKIRMTKAVDKEIRSPRKH